MTKPKERRTRIADELRAEMARQRMTVVSLSAATNIKSPTLRNRLAGRSPFFLEEVDLICTVLGVGLTAFIDRTEVEA